jgi:hypothetical protein
LSDDQADEIYRGLVQILREEGLNWIIDEVETAIRTGRTDTIAVDVETRHDDPPARRRQHTKHLGHEQRDWTRQERLAILLDAVDAAVTKPLIMESDVLSVFPELDGREIVFAPGRFAEDLPMDVFHEGLERAIARDASDPTAPRYEPYTLRFDRRRRERLANADRLSSVLLSARRELDADLD